MHSALGFPGQPGLTASNSETKPGWKFRVLTHSLSKRARQILPGTSWLGLKAQVTEGGRKEERPFPSFFFFLLLFGLCCCVCAESAMSLREVGWHWQDNYVITSSHGGRLGTPNGGPASWKRPSSEGSVAGCGTRRLRFGCTLEKAQLHPLCFCFSFSLPASISTSEGGGLGCETLLAPFQVCGGAGSRAGLVPHSL